MKRLRAWSALMVAAVVAAGSFAQTNEDLQRQLDEFKASMQSKVQKLEAENAALKSQQAPQDVGLETEINRLSERMAAGTNLRSCASQIKLGGEFRYRVAYADADTDNNNPGTEGTFGDIDRSGFWGDARVRLNFQYDFGCDVTAFAELQSRFAFGEDSSGTPGEWDNGDNSDVLGDVGMYQAWLEFRNMFCRPELSARIGRQEVVLGNQFQYGNADWYNGIVHDGLRIDWKSQCWSLTMLAVKLTSNDGDFNQIPSYFSDHDDDELYSVYFTLKSIKNHTLDLYWLYVNGHGGGAHNSGASFLHDNIVSGDIFLYPGSSAYYHTFGARIGGWWNMFCGLDWNVEGAIQTGESSGLDTDGATVEGEIGITLSKSSRFRIFARGLWAQGPDEDGSDTGYLINFPNRHSNTGFRARYGIADIIPMSNVLTAQIGLHFDPASNFTLGATGLWAESDTDNPFTGDPLNYGTELDIWGEYRYNQNITLGAGIAFIWPDDDTGLGDSSFFMGYVQARLVF